MSSRLPIAGLILIATLGGCGSSSSNPNFFTVDIDAGRLTGRYNTAGFTAEQVRGLLADNCKGGLGGYGEKPAEGGLVAFTATCKGGIAAAGGSIEIERIDGKVTSQAMTYDANGSLSTSTRAGPI